MVLKSPEGLLAAVVQSADEAIIAKTLDGIIVSWNPAAERLYGYTADEVIGQSIDLIIPDDRPNELRDILERLRRGERIDHFQTTRRCKDGRLVNTSVTISPIIDDGVIVGASAITRDVTAERHRAERDRRNAMMIHDDIVQGLAIAKLALETGEVPRALETLTATLGAAMKVVEALLADVAIEPSDLRRS
jgi:PAS domain S-box-containing protein